MSRDNNYANMPSDIEEIFRQAAAKHGLVLDRDMFVNDNSRCALDN